MARTDFSTVEVIQPEGNVNPTFDAANVDGNMFANTGEEFIIVKNGGGGGINVTIVTPKTEAGLAIADQVIAIPAGQDGYAGPFRKDLYDQPSGADAGKVYVDYDVVTSVTAMVFRRA